MATVTVFGVSGVGKSWLTVALAEEEGYLHVQASRLLREAEAKRTGLRPDAEALRAGPILDNQTVLIEAFKALRASDARHLLFDGHNIVDTDAGLVEVPFKVVQALDPAGIVFIWDDPAAIEHRRDSDVARARPARKADVIAAYQDRADTIARTHAEALKVPYLRVRSGDVSGFSSAVRGILNVDVE